MRTKVLITGTYINAGQAVSCQSRDRVSWIRLASKTGGIRELWVSIERPRLNEQSGHELKKTSSVDLWPWHACTQMYTYAHTNTYSRIYTIQLSQGSQGTYIRTFPKNCLCNSLLLSSNSVLLSKVYGRVTAVLIMAELVMNMQTNCLSRTGPSFCKFPSSALMDSSKSSPALKSSMISQPYVLITQAQAKRELSTLAWCCRILRSSNYHKTPFMENDDLQRYNKSLRTRSYSERQLEFMLWLLTP